VVVARGQSEYPGGGVASDVSGCVFSPESSAVMASSVTLFTGFVGTPQSAKEDVKLRTLGSACSVVVSPLCVWCMFSGLLRGGGGDKLGFESLVPFSGFGGGAV